MKRDKSIIRKRLSKVRRFKGLRQTLLIPDHSNKFFKTKDFIYRCDCNYCIGNKFIQENRLKSKAQDLIQDYFMR